MAVSLDSLTVTIPRSSAFPSAVLTPFSASSSSISTSLKLPEFKGLKLTGSTRSLRSVSSRSRLLAPRSARVVSESSETAFSLASVNDETWKSLVLESDLPVMVEFWAPWCGPCRIVQPVIDELAQQFAGKLKVYKVNTDESPTIASDYGVRSIPTVIIFKNGEKKETIVGAVPKSTFTTSIEKFL